MSDQILMYGAPPVGTQPFVPAEGVEICIKEPVEMRTHALESAPPRPDLHELESWCAELPGGGAAEGRHPAPGFPHRKRSWVVKVWHNGMTRWPCMEARLEDVRSAEDLWARVLALRDAAMGGG